MTNSFFIQKNLFLATLISSIIMCLSSSSFLSMWMSMEINLFSMIPLISMNQKIFSEKSTMMYFLIQSISSSSIIMFMSLNLKPLNSLLITLIIMAIFMKLGMFPFHLWMISMLEGISWNLAFLMMTLQKIIPISVMMLFSHQSFLVMFCLLNSFVVAISGITMFSMRKILGFSSINHLAMMLMAMILSKKALKMYFLIYSMMTFSATKSLKLNNFNFIFQMMTAFKNNKINNITNLMIFISMAGIPPLLGFMPKMIIILMMMKSNMFLTVMTVLILNTISTFFYLRMSLNNMLMNTNIKKTLKPLEKTYTPFYLLFTPIYLLYMWNFKLTKTINFQN